MVQEFSFDKKGEKIAPAMEKLEKFENISNKTTTIIFYVIVTSVNQQLKQTALK